MQKDCCSERRAFDRLQRASQVSGRPMRVIAEALVQKLRD
jgi:AmiR/NasT family two-component response regulator